MRRFLLACLLALPAAPATAQVLAGAGPEATALVDRADTDRDGRISRSELRDALRKAAAGAPAAFDAYWAGRNAALAGETPAVSADAGRVALRILAEADADGDGTVSVDEARAYLAAKSPVDRQAALYALAMADLDFDGVATKAEIEALRRRVEALGEAPKAASAAPGGEDDAGARSEARRDFLDGRAREREAIQEAWDRLSDANETVPVAELRREVFGAPD